jgi:glycine/D-amino acid oxidase-like deaminating enzyme
MAASMDGEADDRTPGPLGRVKVALGLLLGLRPHDLGAARTFVATAYPSVSTPVALLRFAGWVAGQAFGTIPNALTTVSFARHVSRISVWLASENPVANHPWATRPDAELPRQVEVAVIGAGFTGSACAYHWSKHGGGPMAVLEMNEAASGASGRNEGLVVMGRFFAYVKRTMRQDLDRIRDDLSPDQRDLLSSRFADAYVRSAYRNSDLIEATVRDEGFQCDYTREGWIQAGDGAAQGDLRESVRLGEEAGFDDWTSLEPAEVLERGGMAVDHPAGFSRRTASWHPARWVWSLLHVALRSDNVELFTNTRVLGIDDLGDHYLVRTERGDVRATYVVNATESYSAILQPRLRNVLHAVQTQAAFADGGPASMKAGVGLGGGNGWFGRVANGTIFGSDATRVSYKKAGRNRPSRFVTRFLVGEMRRYFGPGNMRVTREWSCTAGFTDDEYPIVGLLDGKRQYIVAGMCGSGSAVHFNGARHVVQHILGLDGPDDYPAEFFSPTRVLDPNNHTWPSVDAQPTASADPHDSRSVPL